MNVVLPKGLVDTMDGWVETSKDEFYSIIGPLNVSPTPMGKWPYTSLYKTPGGEVRGKVVGYLPEGSALASKRYFVPTSKKGVMT
jgi:hypothetical protein